MPVPDDVAAFLVGSHPVLADLALWVRELVLASEPDLTERLYLGWDGFGSVIPRPATCVPSTRARRNMKCVCCSSTAPPISKPLGGLSALDT